MEYNVQLEPLGREWKTYVHGFLRDGFGTGCNKNLKVPVRIQTGKGEWGKPLINIVGYNQEVGTTIYEVYTGVIDLIKHPDVRHDGLEYFIPRRPQI